MWWSVGKTRFGLYWSVGQEEFVCGASVEDGFVCSGALVNEVFCVVKRGQGDRLRESGGSKIQKSKSTFLGFCDTACRGNRWDCRGNRWECHGNRWE